MARADEKHPEMGSEGKEEIVDGGAAKRNQEHGAAAQPVAERTENRCKDELHDGIKRRHRADIRRDILGMGHVLQERGQNGKDEPDADGIQHNGGKYDKERPVHGAIRSTQACGRKKTPMTCDGA